MKRTCLLFLVLAAAPLAAQSTIAPAPSPLFQSRPVMTADSRPGYRPYSWRRAAVGSAIGAAAAWAFVRASGLDEVTVEDATNETRTGPYFLTMIPAAIVGFIIGGRTGAPPP